MRQLFVVIQLMILVLNSSLLLAQIGPAEPTSFYIALVKDINPGPAFSNPSQLTDLNGTLYFSADNAINGVELWKSDGTETGTQLVKNIHNNGSASPKNLTNCNGTLFFSATDATNGRELWKSDGTSAGTVLVKNINLSGDSDPKSLTVMNNILYFTATDGTSGRELWRSDGTSAGTWRVKNLNGSANALSDSYDRVLFVMGNYLYFAALDTSPLGPATALWRSDGTANGTSLLYSLTVNTVSYGFKIVQPDIMGVAGGQLFFCYTYWDDVNLPSKSLLYKTNGNSEGTSLVKSLTHGLNPSDDDVAILSGTILFQMKTASGGSSPYELWKSNGTGAGTVRVKDTNPYGDDTVYQLETVGVNVFFGAKNSNNEICLWKTDGTSANTVVVKEVYPAGLYAANGKLFFSGPNPGGYEPWRSDGTETGTRLLKDINPNGMSTPPAPFVGVGSRVFFAAKEDQYGYELYKYVPCTACPVGSGREAASLTESPQGLQLVVLENPVRESLTVDISGTDGQPLHLSLTDHQGRVLETRQLEPATSTQRQVFNLNERQLETLLLRAVAGQQSKTVKVVKNN